MVAHHSGSAARGSRARRYLVVGLALFGVTTARADGGVLLEKRTLQRPAARGEARLWRAVRASSAMTDVPVFVRPQDDRAVSDLRALGVDVAKGAWAPVTLDTGRLHGVLTSAGRLQVHAQQVHRPYLEMSARDIGVTAVHAGVGVKSARSGHGVLVGIIDTGIDLTHPAFFDDDGRSRVVAVWDQDRDGTHPAKLGYGHECRESTIASGGCSLTDPTGHGTHVAGIVAGNGELGGIAPQAKIAVVRSNTFTRLADAVAYLIRVADDRDMPLVINLSVGGQYGAHDGATPLEEWLDETLGRGHVMVAAAGNEGTNRLHATAHLRDSEQRLAIERMTFGTRVETTVEMWNAASAMAEVSVELWVDEQPVARAGLRARADEVLETELVQQGRYVIGFTYLQEEARGRVHRSLSIDASAAAELDGKARVALVFEGSGVVDCWVSQSDGGTAVRFGEGGDGWIAGDGRESIAVPASAPSVIAVGAYATRNTWISEVDGQQQIDALGLGTLAPYSSVGPTAAPERTGVKPDITAPGSVIVSARARGVRDGPDVVDARRMIMQGTSMAAPHVSGVAALMLEAAPKLSPADLRRIFAVAGRADTATGELPNASWGLGKIDATAAVANAELEPTGCAASGGSAMAGLSIALWSSLRRIRPRLTRHDAL